MELEIIFVSAGFGLFVLGSILFFLPRRGMFRWSIEARKNLIERYRSKGDERMAQGLTREITALETRTQIYSNICMGIGALLLAVSFFF